MFRSLVIAGLCYLISGFAATVSAQEKLVVIATETLDLRKSGATIDVSKAKGAFRGIRVRAKKKPITLSKVQVIYDDGSVHDEIRRIKMRRGQRSRPINPKKTNRFINTIKVTNKSGRGKAVLEILGIQTKLGARMRRAKALTGDGVVAAKTDPKPDTSAPGTYDGFSVMFGYQDVGFLVDRDVIKVGGNVGKFDRMRLRVLKNSIYINAIDVIYFDGDTQEIIVDTKIPANTRTKWLDIRGDKFIKEVRLNYRSKANFKGQARVEVSGEYADGWLGPGGEGRRYNEGWVLLGAQTADFTGYDTDAIAIGRHEGKFRSLRLVVHESPITLKKIQVIYAKGRDETFKYGRERVDPEKPFGPIELKGNQAELKSIKAQYRTRFDLLGKLQDGKPLTEFRPAVVEIWGQQ